MRSGYLRRQLTESPDITVNLPSGITVETFADVACYCYGADVVITPFNVAALRVAAEWLEMEGNGGLLRRTEAYFFDEVAADAGTAAVVLRSSVALLAQGTEAAAALVERCIEVLAGPDGSGVGEWLDDVAALSAEEFRMIAEAMRARFAHDHDLLYKIVDHYLQDHNGKLTEEEKNMICYTVNCTKLSLPLLINLVQNPRLPLRFVVQAMLIDQLQTRSSLAATSTSTTTAATVKPLNNRRGGEDVTLGAILQRDAVLRQSAQLRATMEATNFRIQNLERDLASLRERLRWSEEKRAAMEPIRSASFRIVRHVGEDGLAAEVVRPSGKSCSGSSSRSGRRFGQRLMQGLKSMFRRPSGESEEVVAEEEKRRGHRRNCSA
ncbi:BTB/POZ domain-containing protein [Cocos nucifera]|uniref:BTB/POZ domain-containing protein n=1 Tax=Cocos nucifera TaxID=13894 RepID=A0A8K0I923_COCNU|nr:BTB/POZ domain-containing protein [Cocos nucifera]